MRLVLSLWYGRAAKTILGCCNPKAAAKKTDYLLQDECACIGCKMCVWCASGTFRIHDQHGRSRVFAQWVDDEDKIEVRPAVLFLTMSGFNAYAGTEEHINEQHVTNSQLCNIPVSHHTWLLGCQYVQMRMYTRL